ncbi:MAG: DUF6228 family protein [Umezawaea sp.]
MTCLDDSEVVIRCEDDLSVEARFTERHVGDRIMYFAVRLRAPGLTADLEAITNVVDGRGLSRFVDGLDFRGWQGAKTWISTDEDLAVSAVFESMGHISLTWTISPWRMAGGRWSASVTTRIEAGAAKDDLATQLHLFLVSEYD